MTIANILQKTIRELEKTGIETAEIDIRAILKFILEKDDVFLIAEKNALLTNSQYSHFRRLIRRRKRGEPLAYILGKKEFFGRDFFVNKNVLIPRPESEMLVEIALDFVKKKIVDEKKNKINILDVGTGSGCLIISLSSELDEINRNKINFIASDISSKALYVARKNVRFYKVQKQIRFFQSDLFDNCRMPKKYDVVIANLPYVNIKSKVKSLKLKGLNDSLSYEPERAIFADDNGCAIIKEFIDQVKNRVNKNGLILIETDCRNCKEIFEYAKKSFPESKIKIKKDLSHLDRIVEIY